jgi:hypothetical protein
VLDPGHDWGNPVRAFLLPGNGWLPTVGS